MATHSSSLAWRISWTKEPGGLQSKGSQRVRHDWATNTFTFQCIDNGEIFLTWPGLALIKSSIVNVDVKIDFVSISQHQKETFYDPVDFGTPGFPVLYHLLEFAQTHIHWVSDAAQTSHPLPPSSPALNLSQHQGLFQWVNYFASVAKVLELQLQYQSFQWISFRIHWFDLTIQGTLKSSLQHNSKDISLWHSAFLMVQLSHPYMTTGKTIALTLWTFVSKVMSKL